jgi:hypothetical protein
VIRRLAISHVLGASLLLGLLGAAPAAASSGPEWRFAVTSNADYFLSGGAPGVYKVEAENVGESPTSGEITLEDIVPAGLSAEAVKLYFMAPGAEPETLESFLSGINFSEFLCPSTVECKFPGLLGGFGLSGLKPGQRLVMFVLVGVPSGVEGSLEDVAKISGGGAPPAEAGAVNRAVEGTAPFDTLHFDASLTDSSANPYTQAGGHPYQFTTEFHFGTYSSVDPTQEQEGVGTVWQAQGSMPVRDPKDVTVDLPPGLIANPQGVPHCLLSEFFTQACEPNKVSVGDAGIQIGARSEGAFTAFEPVLNLQPTGAFPGELGIMVAHLPLILITSGVRTGSDYGVTAASLAVQTALNRVRLNLWGVPADEGHNGVRGKECLIGQDSEKTFLSIKESEDKCEVEPGLNGGGGPAGVPPTPFLTMPTECSGDPLPIVGRYDSWQLPGQYVERSVALPPVDGCSALSFEPTIEARPTTNLADAPSGLEFNLHVPQNEDPEGVATPELKESVVKLPAGLTLNPASAEGLGGCTEAQIGLHSEAPAACPEASKLGTAEVHTRLLNEPLDGFLYLATPHQNPSGSLLAGYIALEGQGIKIKLAGRFETDPLTGQITTKFLDNPQLPFEDLKLDIFGGARGALRTPAVCGSYQTTSSLTPFSAPESGPPATPSSSFETSNAENGGACPTSAGQLPNAPVFRAGTQTPQAGIYSPFSLKLVREDGSQEIKGIDTTLPPGLVGKLAGIPYCPDSALSAAAGKSGQAEKSSPSCPAASEVGSVDVGAGAGPTPINVPGRVYLAGPYKGAPLSLTIITPAVAGPFDLGTVVVRTALYVNPETTQIHAVSDPIPTILEGIPLDVRSITLKASRPNFTLNPTSCEESAFTGSALSVLNVAAPLTQRFQVGGCPALGFKPSLALHLKGGTKRRGHPAITALLQMPAGGANIAATQVALSSTELLDNAHINSPCTRVEFAAGACPAGSILGHARAETPLLDQPLEGNVYLMTGFGHKLPDLVADLNGQIHVVLDGRIDQFHGGLRTTFEAVPDAPVSKFVLALKGGAKGLVQNSVNLCKSPQRATAVFRAQSGLSLETSPQMKVRCRKGAKEARQAPPRRTAQRRLRRA